MEFLNSSTNIDKKRNFKFCRLPGNAVSMTMTCDYIEKLDKKENKSAHSQKWRGLYKSK